MTSLKESTLKFLKRDTMLGGLVVVSIIVFTLLAIGGIMFSYSKKLKYKEASIASEPVKPPEPPPPNPKSSVLIKNGTIMAVEGFVDTITVSLGGTNFKFEKEGTWRIGISGPSDGSGFMQTIISFGVLLENGGGASQGYIVNPDNWNKVGQNILTCYQKPNKMWDLYLNGFLKKSNIVSERNLVPSNAFYSGSQLSSKGGMVVGPDFARVSFS